MSWCLVKHRDNFIFNFFSPPCGVEVKNAWSYISTPPCAFMAGYLFKHRDNLDVCLTFVYECFKYLENFKYLESIV